MSLKLGLLASSQQQAQPLLLDVYPGAYSAYSFRKLRSAYTGNCIQVRRSSDNTLLDIGFVNNVLDTTALLNFCGAGNGFINIWYDQSGNTGRNQTAVTSANQPQIVSSGSLILVNGKAAYSLNGTNQYLTLNTAISGSNLSIIQVFKINDNILPAGYKGTFGVGRQLGFLVKGFNQKVENNDWVTTIEAYLIGKFPIFRR